MDCPVVLHQLMLDCWERERAERPTFGQILNMLDKLIRNPGTLRRAGAERYMHFHIKPRSHLHVLKPIGRFKCLSVIQSLLSPTCFPLFSVYRPTPTMLEPGVGSEVCVSVVPEVCVPEWSVCEWLQSIGLERYRDTLAAAGYTSLESLLSLTNQ